MTPAPLTPDALPTPLTATGIAAAYPGLVVVSVATHELQVTRPDHPTVLRLKLAHADALPEGMATWPGVVQRFAHGAATETSKWDSGVDWQVAWEAWVAGWLTALSSPSPLVARPGLPLQDRSGPGRAR